MRDSYGLLKNPELGSSKTIFGHDDVGSLREKMRADMKLVFKGIMTVEDALISVKTGADAIWVSNGGAAKPEYTASTLTVLKGISTALKQSSNANHVEIFVDSGIRRGTDVLKCLAFGADAVFVSRPVMFGLAMGGEEGVKNVMTVLNDELKLGMALTHCFNLSEVTEKQVIHMVRPKL